MRSSVSGASLTGRAKYSYSSIGSEICSTTELDAASQASTGSKLDSAIVNAVRSTLPESAAPALKLAASSAAPRAYANLTISSSGFLGARTGPPRYNPSIRRYFQRSEGDGQGRRARTARQDLQSQLRQKAAAQEEKDEGGCGFSKG